MRSYICLVAAFGTLSATTAPAAPREQARIFRDLVDCRAIADNVARLACYDGKVEAISRAADKGEVVVADKGQIKEAKKSLFGFGSIRLPFLSNGNDDTEALSAIEAVATAVRQVGYQKWEFTLDNGMRWRQTDDEQIFPSAGRPVTIKRAAMGSYMLKQDGKAVRVVRVQ